MGAPARATRAIALAVVVAAIGSAAACVDLFHGTGDILDACQLDAAAAGCATRTVEAGPDVDSDGYVNFCAYTSAQARSQAERACAWLGACGSPSGHNQLGACMVSAVLAYDCTTNPDRQVLGRTRAFWQCMVGVSTCADVLRCVVPGGNEPCGGTGAAACGSLPGNESTRTACENGQLSLAENCAAWGQTCLATGGGAICAGASKAGACDSGCADSGLVDCRGGVNEGVDCADYGAGTCVVDIGFPACQTTGAHASLDTALVTCYAGTAHSSPSGYAESVDCATLLGLPGACNPGSSTNPPWDVSTACFVEAGTCSGEACLEGGVAQSCARGAAFTANCLADGLEPCALQPALGSGGAYAACSPP